MLDTADFTTPQSLALARAKLYHFLGAGYISPPGPEYLKLLAVWSSSYQETGSASHPLSEQMIRGLASISQFFQKEEAGGFENIEKLTDVEFTRLFRGVRKHYSPPPPYESVYREEEARTFGESSINVQQAYRHFGLDLTPELDSEPPDHLSFEMEFIHLLCDREAAAWEHDKEDDALSLLSAQRQFLEKHLLVWLPKFCGKVREFDRLGFFSGLADLTEGWVTFDYQEHLQKADLFSHQVS